MSLPRKLGAHLGRRTRRSLGDPSAIACAVLIPLLPLDEEQSDFEVLYTLRSMHLPSHRGQVAFPGGKRHAGEDLLATALRESSEEVGIAPADVEVVGCLDDVTTMAGRYVITPWVGVLPGGYPFRPDPGEVADLFTVPLARLADPRHHRRTSSKWKGGSWPAITAGRHEIWGATHAITLDLLERVDEVRRSGGA